MSMLELVGECNRCGLCCTEGNLRCIHLIVEGKLGEPNATRCAVYATRYEGMPIAGVDANGHVRALSVCRKNSVEETRIISLWIGKGCSLKRKD